MSNDVAESINQLIAGHFGHLGLRQLHTKQTVLYDTKLFCIIQNKTVLYDTKKLFCIIQNKTVLYDTKQNCFV